MQLNKLITLAQSGDLEAYDQIVQQFQDMAVAYGYSVLGDFHWAEDAAQEAFLEAFCCLANLQEPLAFPGWLRRIVFKHCDRLRRKKQVAFVSLDAALEEAGLDAEPHTALEEHEAAQQVRRAIALLPEHERSVTVLFYIGQHSQTQIAEFLEVPVSTVKKRLHTARKRLKERIIEMIQENLEEQRPSRNPEFAGRVKLFTIQFSQRIDTGQSIVGSLAALAKQEQDTRLHQVIAQVQRDITGNGREGATLSEAMSRHPDVFGQSYVDAINQGEIQGNLDAVLQQLGANGTPDAAIS